jgi:hypothetical protein
MWVINECTTEKVVEGITETISSYSKRRNEMIDVRKSWDWINVCKILSRYYENVLKVNEKYDSKRTKQLYIEAYD